MKCPTCVKEGTRSSVYSLGATATCMGGASPFWDEDGEVHVHDPNVKAVRFRCSLGHAWSVQSQTACPNPKCDYGRA